MTHNPKRKRRESGKWGEKKPAKDDRTWWMMRERKKRRRVLTAEAGDRATASVLVTTLAAMRATRQRKGD